MVAMPPSGMRLTIAAVETTLFAVLSIAFTATATPVAVIP
jgi:hypothetical protein